MTDGSDGHDTGTDARDGTGASDGREAAATPAAVDRLAREYARQGRPFARVTVVRREPPVSATVGDRAVVTPDGEIDGWIGGVACAQSVAVREATRAIETGEPTLIGLAPDPDDVDRPGLSAFPMTCHSRGTLELFVDPVTPAPRLVVVGDSPIARALVAAAGPTAWTTTRVVDAADADDTDDDHAVRVGTDAASVADAVAGASAVLVATMGAFDEAAVEGALRAGAPYVGLIASRKRAGALADAVAGRLDVDADDVAAAVTAPAGLDLGAETPDEIATSVLAELVAVRRGTLDRSTAADVDLAVASDEATVDDAASASGAAAGADADGGTDADRDAAAVDPVCGMTVDDPAATVTVDGETYRFCGQGCADAFADDPGRYVAGDGSADADGEVAR